MLLFKSFTELAAYLMVYIARADGQVHYLEESTLRDHLGYFSGEPDAEILRASKCCDANPLVKIQDVLNANESLIGSTSFNDRMELIRSLYNIINSDGRVHEEEMATLRSIRMALEQSAGGTLVS
ncbi:MAG: TerB family tellurite resistance protein [Cyclobacteriaceae bacterium]|nr:TerB family tellurite resistance protein [Cyclobacteriaceae bacterium]